MLYDSGKFQLKEPKELSGKERYQLVQEDFNYFFKKAENFKEIFEFCLAKDKLNEAAFLLHQTVERLYSAVLLVFTRYKPNTPMT